MPENLIHEFEALKNKADKVGCLFNLNSTGVTHNFKLAVLILLVSLFYYSEGMVCLPYLWRKV